MLQLLFQILDTPETTRQSTIDEDLRQFPYVNGALFSERMDLPFFDKKMRNILIEACSFDWSKVSPAIFGSLLQSVMDKDKRRNLGAHYTSEKNILKVIRGLFLDDLYAEFQSIKNNQNKLREFHNKLSRLKFFDPACGCGNFLVITYREICKLYLNFLRDEWKLFMLPDIVAKPVLEFQNQPAYQSNSYSLLPSLACNTIFHKQSPLLLGFQTFL